METACNYLDDKVMYVSTDERKMINRILKLAKDRPGEVTITANPKDNDGCLCCKLPAEWLKITPPRRVTMSDEQKAVLAEKLKLARKHMEQPL